MVNPMVHFVGDKSTPKVYLFLALLSADVWDGFLELFSLLPKVRWREVARVLIRVIGRTERMNDDHPFAFVSLLWLVFCWKHIYHSPKWHYIGHNHINNAKGSFDLHSCKNQVHINTFTFIAVHSWKKITEKFWKVMFLLSPCVLRLKIKSNKFRAKNTNLMHSVWKVHKKSHFFKSTR